MLLNSFWRHNILTTRRLIANLRNTQRYCETNANHNKEEAVKYTTSDAAVVDPRHTYIFPPQKRPPYQSLSLCISLSVFMIYFFYLREENDFDENISRPLYDAIPFLEVQTIQAAIIHNRQKGLDTKELEKRLKELEN